MSNLEFPNFVLQVQVGTYCTVCKVKGRHSYLMETTRAVDNHCQKTKVSCIYIYTLHTYTLLVIALEDALVVSIPHCPRDEAVHPLPHALCNHVTARVRGHGQRRRTHTCLSVEPEALRRRSWERALGGGDGSLDPCDRGVVGGGRERGGRVRGSEGVGEWGVRGGGRLRSGNADRPRC